MDSPYIYAPCAFLIEQTHFDIILSGDASLYSHQIEFGGVFLYLHQKVIFAIVLEIH